MRYVFPSRNRRDLPCPPASAGTRPAPKPRRLAFLPRNRRDLLFCPATEGNCLPVPEPRGLASPSRSRGYTSLRTGISGSYLVLPATPNPPTTPHSRKRSFYFQMGRALPSPRKGRCWLRAPPDLVLACENDFASPARTRDRSAILLSDENVPDDAPAETAKECRPHRC